MGILLANRVHTPLATGCTTIDTVLNLADGSGLPNPVLANNDWFAGVIFDSSGQVEIVKVTARSGNSITTVRGQEGTVPVAFNSGAIFSARLTAAMIDGIVNDMISRIATAKSEAISAASLAAFPIGGLMFWPIDSVPTNWYETDGSEVSRTATAALFSILGISYGAGNGSTTYNLPDPRGRFLRIRDHGKGVEPAADSSARIARADGVSGDHSGTTQDDIIEKHMHPIGGVTGVSGGGTGVVDCQAWDNSYYNYYTTDFLHTTDRNLGSLDAYSQTGPARGLETRPKNMVFTLCIKWA